TSPIRFLATPSGLTMDRVRSIATGTVLRTQVDRSRRLREAVSPPWNPLGPGTSGDLQGRGILPAGRRYSNEIRGLDGDFGQKKTFQTVKLSPQPHSSLTFGLWNWKDSFRPLRTKSTWVPSGMGRRSRSTTTLTPWSSSTTSLA